MKVSIQGYNLWALFKYNKVVTLQTLYWTGVLL